MYPMATIQLKMPAERLRIIADCIDRELETDPDRDESAELARISVYFRYRIDLAAGRPAKLPKI